MKLDCLLTLSKKDKLQKTAFRLPKGRQQQRKRPSFEMQKTAFRKFVQILMKRWRLITRFYSAANEAFDNRLIIADEHASS